MKTRLALVVPGLLVVALACGCSSPRGRIMADEEGDLVGDRRAGAAAYKTIVAGALQKLSDEYRGRHRDNQSFGKLRIAFLGVDNKTNEPLGSWRDQMNDAINAAIYESADFDDISYERYLKPALDEVGVSRDKLFLPKNLRQLASILERQGSPVDGALYASLTQGDTSQGALRQADYMLTFELMNLQTGQRLAMAREALRKEYVR